MKQQWIKLTTKLDAMSLRERAMVFGAVTASIAFLGYTMLLEPMLARQSTLLAQINQQQNQVAGIDDEITQKVNAFAANPDAAGQAHLKALQAQIDGARANLRNMQKGLVPPEQIVPLLEHLLRGNGKLRLLSLTTLPVSGLSEGGFNPTTARADKPAVAAVPAAVAATVAAVAPPVAGTPPASTAAAPKPRELLYRHGVEIALQGSYPDMINYMTALEALPSQLFWGKAKLDAGQYPAVTLTLTLYTMSLDEKWMKL
ncbi:type II secretion system protein GspM [Rugamonas sp.]|uniref:type II secretion system protein GspM n=1 Tax=Rugamonas sp. TaxID=1926287 RepID=UPI0025E8E4C5|nr:type II secretion system protein GspM [Rugamonas sp.]